MKKYIIPIAAFMLVAGAINAQVTPQKASVASPVAKVNKQAARKATAATTAVSPSASATTKKTNTDAAGIKRKHTKKHKSVKPVSNK